jgi:hypothetical protein
MSGFAARNHRSRFGRRRLTLLMLNVAIFMFKEVIDAEKDGAGQPGSS